jgi:hypothetical protein
MSRLKFNVFCGLSGVLTTLSRGIVRGSSGTLSLRFDFVCEFSFFAIVKSAAAHRRQAFDRTTPARMQTCRQRIPSARSQTMRASSGAISISQSKHSSIRVIAAALGVTRIGASGV